MTSLLLALLQLMLLRVLVVKGASGPMVTISDVRNDKEDMKHRRFHTKDIAFHNSHIQGIALHATDLYDDYHWTVTAPLVYALPNHGSYNYLMNQHEVASKIVLFDRSDSDDVPIIEQMHTAQMASAAAIIVVDYPNHNEKRTALQVALNAKDDLDLWEMLTIPAVIVRFEHGERLKGR